MLNEATDAWSFVAMQLLQREYIRHIKTRLCRINKVSKYFYTVELFNALVFVINTENISSFAVWFATG